jgi:hypothetical protein
MMSYTSFDTQQQGWQSPQFNPLQWAQFNPQGSQGLGLGTGVMGGGLGPAAFGAQYGGFGGQPYGLTGMGALGAGGFGTQPAWGQAQRQLSPQDVNEVVRQLVPLLPQVIAQAQQQPSAAFAYGPYGQIGYGQMGRTLTPQDVNDVVRAILPSLPHIVGMLQGQAQTPMGAAHWYGLPGGLGQAAFGQAFPTLHAYGQWPIGQGIPGYQQGIGQPLPFPAAFGQPFMPAQQRHLTQQDVVEVARQLSGVIPQVIANLQSRQAMMN